MARDLLFEIGTEELPAAYMPDAIRDMEALARQRLEEAGLTFASLRAMGTPRRLALLVGGLEERQPDALRETRGPRREQAFDAAGTPTRAAIGFARAQGVAVDSLQVREVGGVEYVFAVREEKGRPTAELLPGLLQEVLTGLGFPRSMRWGYGELRFARPIRWMVALYGEEVVPVRVEGLVADRVTWGHRFLAEQPLRLAQAADYARCLEEAYVIVDHDRRRDLIARQVREVAAAQGGVPMENPELLEEVNFLVEYPTAFFGSFSADYLAVPPEVLTTTMVEHQRYFPVFSPGGALMAGFVGVRNGTDYNLAEVREGNERVLRARLEDALFFYREDTREHLETRVPLLKQVGYQARLGTVWAMVERLQDTAEFIARQLGFEDLDTVRRAAFLCKADLETSMVYEFPELQGVMGRYYARVSGEPEEVAQAIFEHYLPRFAGDQLPATRAGIAVSLAEKCDNLVGCFCIGLRPSGSADPYALRRQALGIVHTVLARDLRLDLTQVLARVYQGFSHVPPDHGCEETCREVLDFILQRLRGVLLERGVPYDVLDAVLESPEGDLVRLVQRAQALAAFKSRPEHEDLMVVFNRCFNLSRKWERTAVDPACFEHDAERTLFEALEANTGEWNRRLQAGEYEAYLQELAGLRPMVDALFDAVMVMVEDERVRANRLGLLRRVSNLCLQMGDFSRLV
ncbi:MAG: glycine--tRNA ligase subunit beta [Syntrophomonadaceae bacterium]|nr:glycine--tRNA ligase subunit beta [Syntrophomonadaceae bacterium]